MSGPYFEKDTRGVSAPNSGIDTANANVNTASRCINCGHVGHEHEKTKEYHENGTWSYRYECP